MNDAGRRPGRLVVVATPLGNLGDLSRRALDLLEHADQVYCEDTRRSSTLFSANAIAVNGRLRALHEHNEASMCDEVVDRVLRGDTVVVISDAGTPGISDPGARVVAAVAFQVPERQGDLVVVDERFVEASHRAGKAVHVWTINDSGSMERLLDLGVDGIVSDTPSVLAALLAERGQAWDGAL